MDDGGLMGMQFLQDIEELKDSIIHAIEGESTAAFEHLFKCHAFDIFLNDIGTGRIGIEAVARFIELDDTGDIEA